MENNKSVSYMQAARLNVDELKLLLNNCSKIKYVITSDWQESSFLSYEEWKIDSKVGSNGRAFSSFGEFKWRINSDEKIYLVRWIGDVKAYQIDGNGLAWKDLEKNYTESEQSYLLWGEPLRTEGEAWRNDDGWYQARIPKVFRYPIPKVLEGVWVEYYLKTPLTIIVREYHQSGVLAFDRFIEFEKYISKGAK